MSSTTASKFYHLLAVVYYCWATEQLTVYIASPILRDFPPIRDGIVILLIQLITFWSLAFQIIYFISALCEDILEVASCDAAWKKLKHFNDIFFVYVVWPCTFDLVAVFWTLYSFSPRLIEPYHILFDYITWEMNHVIHTYVAVIVVVEAVLTHRPHTKNFSEAFKFLTANVIVYFGIVIVTQPFGEIWTYPILRDMSLWHWPLLILLCLVLELASHFVGALLNAIVWGRSIITKSDFISSEDELKKTN